MAGSLNRLTTLGTKKTLLQLFSANSRKLFLKAPIGQTFSPNYRSYYTFLTIKRSKLFSRRIGTFVALICTAGGTGISYANTLGFGFGTGSSADQQPPKAEGVNVESAKRVITDEDASQLRLTLYQYQVCPFCCKVRSFLDFYGVKYDIVEVDPVMRRELKFSEYRKVPILVQKDSKGNEIQMNDSSVIISALTTFMSTDQKDLQLITTYYPKVTTESKSFWGRKTVEYMNRYNIMLGKPGRSKAEKEEKKWREWVDGVLVHYIPPNIYRTPTEAVQAFDYISEMSHYGSVKKLFSKYFGAAGMYFVSKGLKKKYELKDDVRQSLYDASREWMAAVGEREFMGGSQPNLADLAVYGVLSSFEGLDAFNDMVRETTIGPWYQRTKQAVILHEGSMNN